MKKIPFIIFLLLANALLAQKADSDCKKMLSDYALNLKNIGTPTGKKVYHMEMEMQAEMKPGSQQPNVDEHLDIYASANKYVCEGRQVSTYIDQENAFSVLHGKKLIYWTNGTKKTTADYNTGKLFFSIQDSLIKVSAVSACKEVTIGEKKYKLVSLSPPSETYGLFKIVKADYYFDTESKKIFRVLLHYTKENVVQKLTMTYKLIDYSYKGNGSLPAAFNKVFKANSRLIPRYAQYQVITQKG